MGTVTRTAATAAVVAALFAASLWWFNYIPDDAYIGMRYARNLAGGEGLAFNPGERVEGYEDFLWVVLLAAGARAGMPVAAGARVLSLLFSAGALALAWMACLRAIPPGESSRSGAAAAGAVFLAAAAPFAACALSGTGIPLFTFLLTAGTEGKRAALPNSRMMIHQPMAGTQGQVSDIVIMTEEFSKTKKRLNQLLVRHTGQPLEQIEQDTDRNHFMGPEEAKNYGLIDKVYEFRHQEKE